MSRVDLKNKIHRYTDTADDKLLKIVNSVFENYLDDKDKIVAYSLDGKPLTQKEYVDRNLEAEKSYLKGHFKTQDELLSK